jgi:SMC interacting uncharacterized protein involved in chromosome segregation
MEIVMSDNDLSISQRMRAVEEQTGLEKDVEFIKDALANLKEQVGGISSKFNDLLATISHHREEWIRESASINTKLTMFDKTIEHWRGMALEPINQLGVLREKVAKIDLEKLQGINLDQAKELMKIANDVVWKVTVIWRALVILATTIGLAILAKLLGLLELGGK